MVRPGTGKPNVINHLFAQMSEIMERLGMFSEFRGNRIREKVRERPR